MEYKAGRLMPIHKLALHLFGWSLLAAASFFFHVVAFVVVILCLADKAAQFKFVYENTKDFPYDSSDKYEQMVIPGVDRETKANSMQ